MGTPAVDGQQHNIKMSDIWLFESCSPRFANIYDSLRERVKAVS